MGSWILGIVSVDFCFLMSGTRTYLVEQIVEKREQINTMGKNFQKKLTPYIITIFYYSKRIIVFYWKSSLYSLASSWSSHFSFPFPSWDIYIDIFIIASVESIESAQIDLLGISANSNLPHSWLCWCFFNCADVSVCWVGVRISLSGALLTQKNTLSYSFNYSVEQI